MKLNKILEIKEKSIRNLLLYSLQNLPFFKLLVNQRYIRMQSEQRNIFQIHSH